MFRAVAVAAFSAITLFSPKAPKIKQGEIIPYQTIFQSVNEKMWVIRAAQVWCESNFNPKAISPAGAMGLAQFMPRTWDEWAPKTSDPFDPIAAIIAQNKYMGWLEIKCKNNLNAALGSYNAGLGNIIKAQRLAAQLGLQGEDAWLRALPRVTKGYSKETINYISKNTKKRSEILKKM